jgi:hypothetical protein
MRSIFLAIAGAGGGVLVYLLGSQLLRYRRKLQADARARGFLATWRKSDVRQER